jgi:hypothetical protein
MKIRNKMSSCCNEIVAVISRRQNNFDEALHFLDKQKNVIPIILIFMVHKL